MKKQILNRLAVECQLVAVGVALDRCLQKVAAGEFDDQVPLVIAVDFEQPFYHLYLAWHFRLQATEELAHENADAYIELSSMIPNFNFNLILRPGIDCESDNIEYKFNRDDVTVELRAAKLALLGTLEKTRMGAYDNVSPLTMAMDFQEVLHHLCLSWHLKGLTENQRRRLSQHALERRGNTVPNFGFESTLLPGIDPG